MKKFRGIKGITLVALVITIVILIILASVSISSIFGKNGIIERAKIAKIKDRESVAEEILKTEILDIGMERLGNITLNDLYNYFSSSDYEKINIIETTTEPIAMISCEVPTGSIKKITVVVTDYEEFTFTIGENLQIIEICGVPYEEWDGEIITENTKKYVLSYSANKGTYVPESQIKYGNNTFIISDIVPIRDGYIFTKWNTKEDGSGNDYGTGDNIQIEESTILYAQWKEKLPDLIIYDANGGKNKPENQTKENTTITSEEPIRDGYTFAGWGISSDATEVSYVSGNIYTGSTEIILYAIWYENIEYLESNGLQYLDTEYYPNQDTTVEFVAETNEQATKVWFGGRDAVNSNNYTFWQSSDNQFSTQYNTTSNRITDLIIQPNVRYTILKDKNITYVNGKKYMENQYGQFKSSSTLTLFTLKENNTIDERISKLKLYSCKIWDNGSLIRNYVPIIDFDGKEGLYDKQNQKIYYFIDYYKETGYIQSNGTEYIDTEYYPNQDTTVEFVAETNEQATKVWFGGRDTLNSNNYSFWQTSDNQFSTQYNTTSNRITDLTIQPNVRYTILKDKNITYVNGKKYMENQYSQFKTSSTLTLFTLKEKNTIDTRRSKLKLYSCKIWDNGTLIRNYVPVIDLTGKTGLLDKVNMKIYYNAGSGSFIVENN